MNVADFNGFRENYDTMSFADMKDFYERMRVDHPEQSHFDLKKASAFFSNVDVGDMRVLELGGWDGELASYMIKSFPIREWVNYEICNVPDACGHPEYDQPSMTDFLWNMDVDFSKFNVFVASHILEHLSEVHLLAMFERVPHIRHVYVDMPREIFHHNTTAAHVLEDSWNKVRAVLGSR